MDVTMDTAGHRLLRSIQALLDGDPPCLLGFSLEIVSAHPKQGMPPLHPVPAPSCAHWVKFQSTTTTRKILLLTCGKAAVISLGEGLIFNLVPLQTVQLLTI